MEQDSLEITADFEAKEEWTMGIFSILLVILFYVAMIWLNKGFWDAFYPMSDTKGILDFKTSPERDGAETIN